MREMPEVQLTAAEWTVLELRVRDGLSVAEIARRRHGVARTVTNLFNRIYQKLGVGGDVDPAAKQQVLAAYYRAHLAGRSAAPGLRLMVGGEPPRPVPHEAAFPPLRSPARPPHNLPLPPTPLVGRDDLLASARAFLRRARAGHLQGRLLTLTGPGGAGKTRLALQLGADLLDEAADGVYFVALASLRDPALVPAAVAQALALPQSPTRPAADLVRASLRDKQMVLILDNFEHLLDAAAFVHDLLEACPGLRAVVTTRSSLRLRGEQELPVPPLALPALGRWPSVEQLGDTASVALFVQRARAVQPDFALSQETAAAVAEICVRLDGLPLALELAAARVTVLAPPMLLARLSSRLKLLTGGPRDLPARQKTLRDAIAWSYDLLDPGEQALFARLSVFVNGCALEAAEAVCSAGDLYIDVLEGVTSLRDKSLLGTEQGADGTLRYVLLETIREYAAERLAESGEEEAVRAAHAQHYLTLAEEVGPLCEGPRQVESLDRLEVELANLRAVLGWAGEQAERVEVGLRVGAALQSFFALRRYAGEGLRWLEWLLAVAPTDLAPAVRAAALATAGDLAVSLGELGRATALLEQGLALYRVLGNRERVAAVINDLGMAARWSWDLERASAFFEEALALFRDIGSTAGIAEALLCLADIAVATDDYERTMTLAEEGLELSQELGDKVGSAWGLALLGRAAHRRGDFTRATQRYEEALALIRDVGDRQSIALLTVQLGLVACHQGDAARATARAEELLALPWPAGDAANTRLALLVLGTVARDQGDTPRAVGLLEQSVAIARATRVAFYPSSELLGHALAWLGSAVLEQGDPVRATGLYEECLAVSHTDGDKLVMAWALRGLGHVARRQGDAARARSLYAECLAVCRDAGIRWVVPGTLEELAHLAAAADADGEERSRAVPLLGAAAALRSALGMPLLPVERPAYRQTEETLRAALGEEAFAAEWAAGQALTLEQALALALGEPSSP